MSVMAQTRNTPSALAWRRFRRNKAAFLSAAILLCIAAAAILAPAIGHALNIDPEEVNLFARFAVPSSQHPLGTDEIGRDLLLRLLYGGRVSLSVGLIAALIAALIGTCIGLIAGFRGGRFDALLMRLTDGIIALPLLPLLVVLAAVDPVKLGLPDSIAHSDQLSLYRIIAIIALFGWTGVARLVRASTLSLREQTFIQVAIAQGFGPGRIMFIHILPNVMSPILIATTLSIGNIILFESILSFLGLGIQPPIPSWGNMLTNAQELIYQAPQLAVYPGMFIFITVIAFNFLGDGLQDALDPRSATEGR